MRWIPRLRKALLKYFPQVSIIEVTETYTHGSGESTEAEVISVKKFSDGVQIVDHDGEVVRRGRGELEIAG